MTPTTAPDLALKHLYEMAAQQYLASLPPEHFMEATPQATQREITLESFALVRADRPDVQVFNELLVQYPRPGERRPGQVVPDNMVVVHPDPIHAVTSYNVPLHPAGPFLVLEYVSNSNKRKDYQESYLKYEAELRVPYYLLFYPDNEELTLFRHTGERYSTVLPNDAGRCAVPELELEVGLLDGWVRYWFRGSLLPLPADLLRKLRATERERDDARRERDAARQAEAAARQAEAAARQAEAAAQQRADAAEQAQAGMALEFARMRAELARLKGA